MLMKSQIFSYSVLMYLHKVIVKRRNNEEDLGRGLGLECLPVIPRPWIRSLGMGERMDAKPVSEK